MSVAEYQEIIGDLLKQIYPPGSVKTEWKSEFDERIYSPRIDIAVGPFSVVDGTNLQQLYDDLFRGSSSLFTSLVDLHLCNLGLFNNNFTNEIRDRLILQKMGQIERTNRNSRCFLAVEIENKVSRKHLMGGAINCSVLGRIGVAVGYTPKMFKAFLNLYRYFEYLRNVGKTTFDTSNLVIVDHTQFEATIRNHAGLRNARPVV